MSTEDSTDGQDQGADGTQLAAPQSNFDRLATHLRKDSLTAKLVSAYAAAGEKNTAQAIKDVMTARLDELKREYDAPEYLQD